jgi:antirestriction protein ArdC
MSKNFKPLHEQIAQKLIAELKAGTSMFQKPWSDSDKPAFNLPVNPTTGKNYRGMNALWLAMQDHTDPRWMTLKQASFNDWTVEKGAKATLINFIKTSDIQAMRDPDGNKILDEDGQTQTRTIKLDKPVITNAWVFNAEQIKGIPPLAQNQSEQTWTPLERAEQMLADSKAVINHGGNEAYYNLTKDSIQLPGKDQFENETKYYAVALHELGHWTGHPERLNRPMEGRFGSESYAREELRAEIASLMLGSELQIGHNFGQHAAYVHSWIKILKEDPYELYKASADAQHIFDYMLDIGQKVELKEKVAEAVLNKGDIIPYKNAEYKVLAILKGKTAQMEELQTGNKFKLGPKDGLYASLVNAKNNPQEPQLELAEAEEQTQSRGPKR